MNHQRHLWGLTSLCLSGALALVTTNAWPGQVGPSFDCARAEGVVEALICEDEGLASLDRIMAAAYAEALKRFFEEAYKDPQPGQRAWIKERDDCAQAPDPHGCVETHYKHRIAELEIKYGHLKVPQDMLYRCGDMDLVVVFYSTDPPAALLTPVGRHAGPEEVLTFRSLSGSGAKYTGQDVTFWVHQGEGILRWLGEELSCTQR